MKTPSYPFVQSIIRNGRTYHYFRRGKLRVRLPDDMSSQEFSQRYWEIRSGASKPASRTSWEALIVSYLKSPAFTKLSTGTRANYRRHCDDIRTKNGPKDVRAFRRKNAIAARDALSESWSKANERVAVLSILCRHAVDLEWIDRNPVVDIEKLQGGEYQAWPDQKLRAFERYCDEHGCTLARAAYELAIGTGQRLGDCLAMRWSDFDGEYIRVAQEKTGVRIEVYCPQRLQGFLQSLPQTGAHILARNLTQPMGKRAVQKAIEEVRAGIGVMTGKSRLVPHGWRYTAAKQLADSGVSDADIQSVTGHKTLTMVQKYRQQASQKVGSKRAQQAREWNRNKT